MNQQQRARPPVLEPTRSPLSIAISAAEALTGAADAEIKAKTKSESEVTRRTQSRVSPLAKVLALRLQECHLRLSQIAQDVQLDIREDVTDEQLHSESARLGLLCVRAIHRYQPRPDDHAESSKGSDSGMVGARDRKTVSMVLSVVSQWGFAPAIWQYDSAFAALQGSSKASSASIRTLEEESNSDRIKQAALVAAGDTLSKLLAEPHQVLQDGLQSFIAAQFVDHTQPLASYLLASAVRLAFGPTGTEACQANSQATKQAHELLTILLKRLPATTLLPLLSSMTSSEKSSAAQDIPQIPSFVRRIGSRFLSAQLLRPEGVLALVSTVVGSDQPNPASNSTSNISPTARMDRLATLLTTPPPGLEQATFFELHILPPLLSLVKDETSASSAHIKAATHTFAAATSSLRLRDYLRSSLQPLIWQPLSANPNPLHPNEEIMTSAIEVESALRLLESLVLHSPPTSEWLAFLLDDIALQLWLMLEALHSNSINTPHKITEIKRDAGKSILDVTRARLELLLRTWLGVATESQLLTMFDAAAQPETARERPQSYWRVEQSGVQLVWGIPPADDKTQIDLTSLMADIQLPDSISDTTSAAELKLLSTLNRGSAIRPSPQLLSRMLFKASRSDLAAALLPNLLEKYLLLKSQSSETGGEALGSVSTPTMHLLQTIVSLLGDFGESIIKQDSLRALRFVHFCLSGRRDSNGGEERAVPAPPTEGDVTSEDMPFLRASQGASSTGALEDLSQIGSSLHGGNGRPGAAEQEPAELDELDVQLVKTALELLLSILESNADLSPASVPLLHVLNEDILQKNTFGDTDDSELRSLLKEARLVLLSRTKQDQQRQSESTAEGDGGSSSIRLTSKASQVEQEVNTMYEEALKLLQDPILPVRAHGLSLLRQLAVSAQDANSKAADAASDASVRQQAAHRLLPKVRDLLLQAIQDEESYLYLNAIAGLKEVILCGQPWLSDILGIYTSLNLNAASSKSHPLPQDVRSATDVRLRLGETLLQAIQKLAAGGAAYIDVLLPPLCESLRLPGDEMSTTLKSSAISLLGTCVEAFPDAIARKNFAALLVRTAVEILQVEGVTGDQVGTLEGIPSPEAEEYLDSEDEDMVAAAAQRRKQRANWAPGADDATRTDGHDPQLRRGALLLLALLIRGARHQIEDVGDEQEGPHAADDVLIRATRDESSATLSSLRLPGGGSLPAWDSTTRKHIPQIGPLLFDLDKASSVRTVAAYAQQIDIDAMVRHQAGDVLDELKNLELAAAHAAMQ